MAVMRAMMPASAAVHRAVGLLPVLEWHETGLKGYRLAAYSELPRTGMPELSRTEPDYDEYVGGCSAPA